MNADLATTRVEPLSGHQTRSVGGYRGPAWTQQQDGHAWPSWLKYCVARILDTTALHSTSSLSVPLPSPAAAMPAAFRIVQPGLGVACQPPPPTTWTSARMSTLGKGCDRRPVRTPPSTLPLRNSVLQGALVWFSLFRLGSGASGYEPSLTVGPGSLPRGRTREPTLRFRHQ